MKDEQVGVYWLHIQNALRHAEANNELPDYHLEIAYRLLRKLVQDREHYNMMKGDGAYRTTTLRQFGIDPVEWSTEVLRQLVEEKS